MNIIYLVAILFCGYLLSKTTDLTVKSLRTLREKIQLNELVISLFFLGAVTSIPEVFVAIMSAVEGIPELSLGNLIGANIVVLSFLVGITSLFSGKIRLHNLLSPVDFILCLVMTGLPTIFVLDGSLTNADGWGILIAFGLFLLHFYQKRNVYAENVHLNSGATKSLAYRFGAFYLSIAALLLVSHVLVEISVSAALAWGVPVLFIGLLVISLGTNMPEIGFVFQQIFKTHGEDRDITTGVLLGNAVMNAPIMGLLGILRPFEVADMSVIYTSSVFFLGILIFLGRAMLSGNKLSRSEGFVLILIYVAFVVVSLI